MQISNKRKLALAVSAALTTTLTSGVALGQNDDETVEEVVVTGSRIIRANLESSSPVTELSSEQIQLTGLTRIEDVLSSLPSVSLSQSSGQAIESDGTATLELRRLGTERTLVLMNGRRLPVGSPNGSSSAPDINLIPGALVDRVEVLTGGASSTYGADAVAGVVNFIMKKDFEGIQLDVNLGQYRHENDGNIVSASSDARGFPYATGTSTDGDVNDFTLTVGGNFADGKGNMTGFVTYRDIEGVQQSERDYSACAIYQDGAGGWVCGGSSTNAGGTFINAEGDVYNNVGNELVPGYGVPFNYAPPSYFQRPDKRVVVGTFGNLELSDRVEAYTELMFMDTKSDTQYGPSGIFYRPYTTNCDNPFLSDQQRGVLGCTGPDDDVEFTLARRNVEGGPRQQSFQHTTYRGVFGLRGNITDAIRYDVSWQHSRVDMNNNGGNFVDLARISNAIAVELDESGTPVCAAGSADGCAPYNVWETGGVSDEVVAYYGQTFFEEGRTDQTVLNAQVQISLGEMGIVIPSADNGIELLVGYENRKEGLNYSASDNLTRGAVGGFSAAAVPVDGEISVDDFFVEAYVPIVEGANFAQELSAEIGYRYSDYDSGFSTDTYKFAGNWQIVDAVKVRGSYARAVRAPNVVDLFQPQAGGLFAMADEPCGGVVNGVSQRGYTLEQCANTGVSAEQWAKGGAPDSPASQYNTVGGGNPDLEPEEADTYTFGVVFSPMDNLNISVDYFNIEIEGAIAEISQETTLINCIETGDPTFCSQIQRGQLDSLWVGQATTSGAYIAGFAQNIATVEVSGVDIELDYTLDMGGLGQLGISSIVGITDEYKQEEYAGAGVDECAGVYGGACSWPTPDFSARTQATWLTPWGVTASATWRFIDKVDNAFAAEPVNIDSFNYLDIAATWQINDMITVRGGINNVLDEEPPMVQDGATSRVNGNTYPGMYDPLGQYMFAGFTLNF